MKVNNRIDTGESHIQNTFGHKFNILIFYRRTVEHQKRAPETIDETSRFHPGENTDPGTIETVSRRSIEERECYTVQYRTDSFG